MMEPFTPAKARAKLPKDIEDPQWIAEPKLDGSRYLMYVGFDPYKRREGTTLLSRRISSKDGMYVDKTDNVPHLCKPYPSLDVSMMVIDGEIKAPGPFSNTVSVMGSLPDTSHMIQAKIGEVTYHVFDILRFGTTDYVALKAPLAQRRTLLEIFVKKMDNPHIVLVPQVTICKQDFYDQIVHGGGEGIMLKDLEAVYGKGWAKMKKRPDVSVVIMGSEPGEGKYKGLIGNLVFGVYMNNLLGFRNKHLTEIGKCSGFDDAQRRIITLSLPAYMGQVMDVHYQEVTSGNRLRHPSFFRFRRDVQPDQCTWDSLMR